MNGFFVRQDKKKGVDKGRFDGIINQAGRKKLTSPKSLLSCVYLVRKNGPFFSCVNFLKIYFLMLAALSPVRVIMCVMYFPSFLLYSLLLVL